MKAIKFTDRESGIQIAQIISEFIRKNWTNIIMIVEKKSNVTGEFFPTEFMSDNERFAYYIADIFDNNNQYKTRILQFSIAHVGDRIIDPNSIFVKEHDTVSVADDGTINIVGKEPSNEEPYTEQRLVRLIAGKH